MSPAPHPTPRTAARLAGVGYVAIFALAIFANFFVRVRLVVPDDAAATVANLADSEPLLRAAIVAFLIVFLLDVGIAWALHHVFRGVGEAISALAAWFRIVYTVFLGVAVVFLFAVLQLTGDGEYLAALGPKQRDAQVMLALEAFNATWLVGLTAFGVHLVLVGSIMARSRLAPGVLGSVLVVAGAAYVLDTLAYASLSNYADHQSLFTTMVALPSVVAEAAFAGWLLSRRATSSPTGYWTSIPPSTGVNVTSARESTTASA